MSRVVIHSTAAAARAEMARAILTHFGIAPYTVPYQEPRITIPLPGIHEDDARQACELYLMPHGVLHFVYEETA